MKTVNAIAIALLFLTLGCSKSSNELVPPSVPQEQTDGVSIGNGNYLRMEADLAEAVSLTANLVAGGSSEKKHLLKITKDKKVLAVLSGEHQLLSYKLTPTHIIAHVDIQEGLERCSLIAIPKVPGKSKVLCLNRQILNCDSTTQLKRGYDVKGSQVYFTYYEPEVPSNYLSCATWAVKGGQSAVKSELRHWDGVSEKVSTLFHTDPQPTQHAQLYVSDVFASETNGNLCIDVENNGDESLLCRQETTGLWEKMKAVRGSGDEPYLKLGNTLLSSSSENSWEGIKLNLATFETEKRKGKLPTQIHFPLDNGGFIGNTGYEREGILCVGPEGDSKKIWETDLDGIRPVRLGNYAWYYGRESLRRISLQNCELDAQDYFDRTKLLRLSSLAWAVDDLLRVDGTAPTGFSGSAFLTSAGELFSTEESTIPLEHPIDLKW